MAKRRGRKSIDRQRHQDYLRVAEHFYEAAEASMELEYWTATGVLVVHSAIAFVDSLTIKFSGQKSIGDNHEDAVAFLNEVVAGGEEKNKALNHFRRIIEEKTRVSYVGELFSPARSKELWKQLKRFREWAEHIHKR